MEYIDSLLLVEDSEDENEMPETSGFVDSKENLETVDRDVINMERSTTPNKTKGEPSPDWCKCKMCKPMIQEIENRCCGRVCCGTSTRRFKKLCLDPEILQLCVRNRADIRNDRENNGTAAFRKAAYRQYVLERYGYLGKGNCRVAPSCVVLCIKRQYPSATGVYMGFRTE